jgi:hypothetical protein
MPRRSQHGPPRLLLGRTEETNSENVETDTPAARNPKGTTISRKEGGGTAVPVDCTAETSTQALERAEREHVIQVSDWVPAEGQDESTHPQENDLEKATATISDGIPPGDVMTPEETR